MLRLLSVIGVIAVLGSAVALYTINYSTRRLEMEVSEKVRARVRLEKENAILKADRAYLANPKRIEAEARRLGMRPANKSQVVYGASR